MKIINCRFYRYSLPLVFNFKVAADTIHRRDGIIIVIEDESGKTGFGEASPLPGLHSETVDDIIKLLPAVKTYLLSPAEEKNKELRQSFPPSLRFAVDACYVNLKAKLVNVTAAEYLNHVYNGSVKINALLLSGEMNNLRKIGQIREEGFDNIKVKIRPERLREDAENILRINSLFGGKVSFRIDANRSLTLKQALEFSEKVKGINIDYFEEPLEDAQLLPLFYRESGYPFAVDESLGLWQWEKIAEGLKAVIIKPQLYGGLSELKNIIESYKSAGVRIVFSDVFSSGVGLDALVQYAAAFGAAETAMGLYTYRYLEEDILTDRLSFVNGQINTRDSWHKAQNLNYKCLRETEI